MFEFTKDCFIGVNKIDDLRIKFFELLNSLVKDDLSQNSVSKLGTVIEKLSEYAGESFKLEEEYMTEMADKELETQKKDHENFIKNLEALQSGMEEINDETARQRLTEIVRFMVRWLYSHLVSKDTLIGRPVEIAKAKVEPETVEIKAEDNSNPFAFTSKFYTGIQFVDDEHKKLFEIIEEANNVILDEFLYDKYDQIAHILNELLEYTKIHFSDEEEYMESINYEGLPMQRKAHALFIEKIENIDLDEVDNNQDEYLKEILDFLLNWLGNHILKVDMLIPKQK